MPETSTKKFWFACQSHIPYYGRIGEPFKSKSLAKKSAYLLTQKNMKSFPKYGVCVWLPENNIDFYGYYNKEQTDKGIKIIWIKKEYSL